ncbi:fasciclin domain-containing protein [Arcticibacter sp.]|uniref:fasciclin domain-containing protein n=1 Tax=Arcticibacter sp. TaxID=1872630 RepID=UPI00388D0B09
MILKPTKLIILIASFFVVLAGCKDQWDDHNALTDPAVGKSLLQAIEEKPELTRFRELLVKTGYDKIISSANVFTIWAPDNDALQSLDQTTLNDTTKLKQFIGNYIVSQSYFTNKTDSALRIETLNGKYIKFHKSAFEGISLKQADLFTGNGTLHIIGKLVSPKPNIWEFLNASASRQKDYITGLEYDAIDSATAEQIGIDPVTGKPIFKPGTGVIKKNHLFDKAGNLANEGQEYTVILLNDDALDAELQKFSPYTQGTNHQVANSYTVLKDLVFSRLVDIDTMKTDTLVSADGVKVPFKKSSVIEKIVTSNGYIYKMSSAPVKVADKIMTIKREGELPDGFSRTDKSGNISYRLRRAPEDPETDRPSYLFNDIYIFNHKVPLFHVRYNFKNVYKGKYKVYWVAPNDVQTVTFKQRVAFNNPYGSYLEKVVPLKDYKEVEVGEYTVDEYGDLAVYIISDNNGTDGTNSINIDYFKLVPQLP